MSAKRDLPAPPIKEQSKLAAYAVEHLVYEVEMLFAAAKEMRADKRHKMSADAVTTATPSVMLGVPDRAWFPKMARIEAFATHYRNLVVFLFPDEFTVLRDDVCAHHFVSGPDPLVDWVRARGPLPQRLRAAKARADKELAHLTTERKEGVTRGKAWPVDELIAELAPILEEFLATADGAALGGATRYRIAEKLGSY